MQHYTARSLVLLYFMLQREALARRSLARLKVSLQRIRCWFGKREATLNSNNREGCSGINGEKKRAPLSTSIVGNDKSTRENIILACSILNIGQKIDNPNDLSNDLLIHSSGFMEAAEQVRSSSHLKVVKLNMLEVSVYYLGIQQTWNNINNHI